MKPHFSPSQFSTAASCLRKWYYESVQGRRQPETEAMRRGTRIHRMLEVYVQDPEHPLPTQQKVVEYTENLSQTLIDDAGNHISERKMAVAPNPAEQRMANSALVHLPDPRDEEMLAEGKFILDAKHTGFGKPTMGFIDLWMPRLKLVSDYKTRSSDRYDKDEEELRSDPQCIIYAKVKLLEVQPDPDGKRRIHFQHINVYTNGKKSSVVRLENIDEDEVERGLTRLRGLAVRMLIAEKLPVTDVPVNVNACDRFGGCPFRMDCGRHGLPVYGDNWQSRQAKAMAVAEGTYKSPQQLEEQMSGFASSFLAVNPPDGTPADVVGNEAKHVEAETAAVEARSELDEESQGEAPAEAMVEATPRLSARDRLIQEVFEAAVAIASDDHLKAFHRELQGSPANADDLRALLLRKKLPELRKLLTVATTYEPAAAPAAIGTPTNLAELAIYADAGRALIAKGEKDVAALDKKIAELRAARNAAEEAGDDDKAEALSGESKRSTQAKKDALEALEKLRAEFSDERLEALKKELTPPAPEPEPAPEPAPEPQPAAEVAPAPQVKTAGKPFLLISGQYIADDARILHVEPLLPKYHAVVASTAGVESIHEIKFEGPARVAALLAHDIKSGILDLQKYTAVSVPRRGANWDPIIDVLRPHVLAIFDGGR